MKLKFRVLRYNPSCFDEEEYMETATALKENGLKYYTSDLIELESITVEVKKYIEVVGSDECDAYYFYDENDNVIPFDKLIEMKLIGEMEGFEGAYGYLV